MSTAILMRITLSLARTKAFPNGSVHHRYEFIAPLDDHGRIDAKAWSETKGQCKVYRFWGDEPVKNGVLTHRAGGHGGATWGFDYDPGTRADDESGFHFNDHVFKLGEYVSIRNSGDGMETFKITAMSPV
jgi:hypothetical protein